MTHRPLAWFLGIVTGLGLILGLAGWYYIETRDFMAGMGALAAEKGTALLESRVDIGAIRVASLHSLEVLDIAVYDKQGRPVLKADSALVGFSFFGMLFSTPIEAVSRIEFSRPEVWLTRRPDGTWNYEELTAKDSTSSRFQGIVATGAGVVHLDDQGKHLDFTAVAGEMDFAMEAAPAVEVSARRGQERWGASGFLGDALQLDVEGHDLDIAVYQRWLPADALPEEVQIRGGLAEEVTASLRRSPQGWRYEGEVRLSGGVARVWDREIKEIEGQVAFSDREAALSLRAESEGQRASAKGKIYFSSTVTQLDLIAESEGFDPSAVFSASPFQGAVAFSAHVTGTPSAPLVEGDFRVKEGTLSGYSFQDARARAAYYEGRVAVRSLTARVFDGQVRGAGEFEAASRCYDGTLVLQDVDVAGLGDLAAGGSGRLSAELGFAGEGMDMGKLRLYGSASVRDAALRGIAIPEAQASFSSDGDAVILDYLSARVEGSGEIGLEGRVVQGKDIDLSFTGSRIDLGLARRFWDKADMSGLAEMSGTMQGNMDNPTVQVTFSATEGQLFKQPFKTLHGAVSGSLDGVGVDSFSMENGNGVNWLVQGTVGFTGARRIHLQVDTMNVRMEDIAALVAPEQPITGEVDNIITVTGTLDDPDVVGYVHFRHGSYRGYLLSGMDGDYTLKNGLLTLHDFHIFSPLVDMDLNGTVLPANWGLDLHVAAHDIDLNRFSGKLPYPIEGHGTFDGYIGGTIAQPTFDGVLDAPSLLFNGAAVTNGHGQVTLRGNQLTFAPFRFDQNGGYYTLQAAVNIDTMVADGHASVSNGDIHDLLAIANVKNDAVHGRVDGIIDFSGTLENPAVDVDLYLGEGHIGAYPISEVYVEARMRNRVITLNRFSGRQGNGSFAALGRIDLDGAIQGRFSTHHVAAGLLTAAAGSDIPLYGLVDLEAQFGGTADAPTADASLTVISDGQSAAFDTLSGLFRWRGQTVRVEQLLLQKSQNGHAYKASAYGTIPLAALTSKFGEEVAVEDRIDLRLSLDEADLGLLPLLVPEIDWALGTTYGSLHIGGTLAAPSLDGAIGVKDGAVKFKALNLPLTQLQLGLKFEDDVITVTDGSGRMGGGTFRLEGATRLEGRRLTAYRLTAEANRLDIQSHFYHGPLTGTADIREGGLDGEHLPKLTARITVDDARISLPSIPETQGELPLMLLDVGLQVGRHTHFYSSRLYDIWLEGGFHYGGTTLAPQPSGAINVRRGSVTYVQTTFKISEGVLAFNQVDSFLPSLQFQADARLNRTRIFLSIHGPIDAMEFHLTSSPPMGQEEILRLLTLRGAYRSGQTPSGADMTASFLEAGLQMSFLNIIEDTMRDLLQLDEFRISQDVTDGLEKKGRDNQLQEAYNIEIGKYISDKVMISYTQGINHPLRRYSLRYDFNDRFSAILGRNENNHTWVGIESRISF